MINLDEDERIAREAKDEFYHYSFSDRVVIETGHPRQLFNQKFDPEKALAYVAAVRERDADLKSQARMI